MQAGGVRVIKMQDAGYVQDPQNAQQGVQQNVNASYPAPQGMPLQVANVPIMNAQQQVVNQNVYESSDDDSDVSSVASDSDDDSSVGTPSQSSSESMTPPSSISSDGSVDDDPLANQQLIGGASDDDTSSISTADILSKDPLFLVLSEFLMDEEGTNIVTMLGRINKSLKALKVLLENQSKSEKKKKNKH